MLSSSEYPSIIQMLAQLDKTRMESGNSDYESIYFTDTHVVKVVSARSWMHSGLARYPRNQLVDIYKLTEGFVPMDHPDPQFASYEYSDMNPDNYMNSLIARAEVLSRYYDWLGEQSFEFEGCQHKVGEILLKPQFVVGTIYDDDLRPFILAIQDKVHGKSTLQLQAIHNARAHLSPYKDHWNQVTRMRNKFDAMIEQLGQIIIPSDIGIEQPFIEPINSDAPAFDDNYGNLMFETDIQDNLVTDENGNLKVHWIDI